jgi:hypothetical protein
MNCSTQQQLVAAHIPSHITGCRHDLLVVWCSQEAALGFFEVPLILEW